MHTTPEHVAIPGGVPPRSHALHTDASMDERHPPAAVPDGSTASPDVVLVKSGFKHVAIRVREIVFVEAARNYVHLHLESGAVLKSRVPIDRLARHLGAERFLRVHRGRLVNLERIRAVSPLTGGRLRLALLDGATIVVARDRRRVVLAEITARGARRS
jgi:DNA-binding LytR/AlgR family response regulator